MSDVDTNMLNPSRRHLSTLRGFCSRASRNCLYPMPSGGDGNHAVHLRSMTQSIISIKVSHQQDP
ncbi:hypothetical protein M378DRAFT_164397, partial [Amanita muscaria Koide BX008]